MASVQKKKDRYYPVAYSPIVKRNLYGEGFSTYKAAERALPAWVRTVKSGFVPEPKKQKSEESEPVNPYLHITFQKVYEDFELSVLPDTYKSRNNRDTLRNMIRAHVLPVIGQYPIEEISFGQLQTMIATMVKVPAAENKESPSDPEPLSSASKRKIIGYMNKIYEYAMTCKYVDSNPCRDIVVHSTSVVFDKPVWDEDTIYSFLEWCRDNIKYSYYLAFLIAATTASRRGEFCAIKYVDIKDGYLHKNRGMDRYGEQTDMKTHVSHRGIYLMDITLDAIEEQRRRQNMIIHTIGNMSAIQESVKPWDYIITDEWNKPIKPDVLTNNFRKAVRRYQKEVDSSIPYISLKGLRDSYASIALAAGENVKEVSEQLGHAKPSTTLNRYASLIKAPTKGLNQRMNERMFSKHDDNSGEIAQ